jgi:hypothetical protein
MAMYVQPLHTIVAVQTGGSAFKVFTRAELGACQLLGRTYFCLNNNILDKRTKTNCVLGLFNRDQEALPILTSSWELINFYYIWQTARKFNWFAARNLSRKHFRV